MLHGENPDLIVTAKSPGGGLALAAITARAEIMDAPGPGGLGGTFGGNPACCAAALAVFEPMGSYWLAPARRRAVSTARFRVATAACV